MSNEMGKFITLEGIEGVGKTTNRDYIRQLVEKAGKTDTDDVVDALRANKFETVLGNIGFDETGDVTAPGYVFYVWKDGKYDYVQ